MVQVKMFYGSGSNMHVACHEVQRQCNQFLLENQVRRDVFLNMQTTVSTSIDAQEESWFDVTLTLTYISE